MEDREERSDFLATGTTRGTAPKRPQGGTVALPTTLGQAGEQGRWILVSLTWNFPAIPGMGDLKPSLGLGVEEQRRSTD